MNEFERLMSRNWTQAEADNAEEAVVQRAGHILFAEVSSYLRREAKP